MRRIMWHTSDLTLSENTNKLISQNAKLFPPSIPRLYRTSLPSPLKVLTSIVSMCVMYVRVFMYIHQSCTACLRENFALQVLSLISYHKVNIPKSSFTFLDEWECPRTLVSPGVLDIPSADKELIRAFFFIQLDVISQCRCENRCFMPDQHPVFSSITVMCFFLSPISPTVKWIKACFRQKKKHKQPQWYKCWFFLYMFDALCYVIFYHTEQ